jgi:hypothetical protein
MKNYNLIYLSVLIVGIIIILIIIKCKHWSEENFNIENRIEGMKYTGIENTRNWPYYYYSQAYSPESGGGGWPSNMYSRMREIAPGFHSGSGLTREFRPGMGVKFWPRSRWINNKQVGKNSYFTITNNEDLKHDASDYSYPSLNY